MERFNRAERRAQVARLKAKRKSYWGYPNRWTNCVDEPPGPPAEMDARQLGKVVQYPQACSCRMGCGNAREYYGRSLKEIVQIVTMKEEVTMLFS